MEKTMQEIKVVKSEIEPILRDLIAVTNRLDLNQPKTEFLKSTLSIINKIEDIEQNYYELLKKYKSLLLTTENEAWSAIERFIEAENKIADSTFGKETVR
ncbi:DUF5344 family protein [Heyndrickxia sporothermodurans]|uniref:DUF5344 family protein n=1 Tax=Heyndrickxia sporothermodurans TaxID=46224 RepID=UPI002E20F8DF|nr:DUF5344 family protein [Heyndrickxia sporothermodurans]